MSILRAYEDDADRQIRVEKYKDQITGEEIHKEDRLLATYSVISDAFRGGMGSVWKVHHDEWDIDLAAKQPLPLYFAEAGRERKADFISECENWIMLGMHPGIVSCYYVREISGIPTIFSEWMDGGSLKDRIGDGTLYDGEKQEVRERILSIAVQTSRGLRFAHSKGLVHQDIKPGNILLTGEWEAKIADFGLAKARSRITEGSRSAAVGYTIAYCPYEQTIGAEPAPWMDYYALALTILEMYAGERIWDTGAGAFSEIFEKEKWKKCKWAVEPPEKLMECIRRYFAGTDGNGSLKLRFESDEDFTWFDTALTDIYREVTGREYPEDSFDEVSATVDALNNLALSYLDLGKNDTALEYWKEALSINPVHPESAVNEGLCRWREAQITDLDMFDRLSGIRHLGENADKSSFRGRMHALKEQFYAESEEGMEDFLRSIFENRQRESVVAGQYDRTADPLPIGGERRALAIRICEGSVCYDTEEHDRDRIVYVSRRYCIDNGRLLDVSVHDEIPEENSGLSEEIKIVLQDENADLFSAGSAEGNYRFRLKTVESFQDETEVHLQILEEHSERVIKSVRIHRWDHWQDEKGKIHDVYPMLITDYTGNRLIFVSSSSPAWALYNMPKPPFERKRMPYIVSRPVPLSERRVADRERERYKKQFIDASEADDFDQMNSAYAGIWKLPMTAENRLQAQMNAALMKSCRMPGVYKVNEFCENRIWEHDPADPSPVGIYGILPLLPERGSSPFEDRDAWPEGTAFRDDPEKLTWYVPWGGDNGLRKDSVKVYIRDKRSGSMYERMIRLDPACGSVRRVIAASFLGNFLILEMRGVSDDFLDSYCEVPVIDTGEGEPFKVVCITLNGRFMREILCGRGEFSFEAVFLEDGQFGPNKGYIWQPYSRLIVYFEMEGDDIYSFPFRERGEAPKYAFPMPDALFPSDRYGDPYRYEVEIIESITMDATGHFMGVVTVGTERTGSGRRKILYDNKNLYVYSADRDAFEKHEFSSLYRILISANMTYFMIGMKRGIMGKGISWYLYPMKVQKKQKPHWELREFSVESRIRRISDDLCTLLDARGRPLYAICWKYGR